MDVRTYKWTEFLPILQDFVPSWGRCPKRDQPEGLRACQSGLRAFQMGLRAFQRGLRALGACQRALRVVRGA